MTAPADSQFPDFGLVASRIANVSRLVRFEQLQPMLGFLRCVTDRRYDHVQQKAILYLSILAKASFWCHFSRATRAIVPFLSELPTSFLRWFRFTQSG